MNADEARFAPYPMFACLGGRRVVVVGGGVVAERKARTLRAHGALVRVVASEATDGLRRLADEGAVEWAARPYRRGDLADALLAVGSSDDPAVNGAVFDEACAKGTLANIVDVPDLCTFIVPSTLRRGRLQIAVSTGGAAPAVARGIRKRLEAEFPAWWEGYLDLMAEVRLLVKERVPGPAERRAPLHEAVAASGLERRMASGERPSAEEVYEQTVRPLLGEVDS